MERVSVTLNHEDFHQIVREYTDRMRWYNNTADFHDGVDDPNLDLAMLADADNSNDARKIADHYMRIVDEITRQLSYLPQTREGRSERWTYGPRPKR